MADEKEDTRESEAMRKIFVGGLNKETTDEGFLEYFSQFGNTVDNIVMKDPHTQQSRCFGFITYDASNTVENVFRSRPHVLDGKTVDCKRAMPKEVNNTSAHAKVTKLFVGGIKEGITQEKIREYFEIRHQESDGKIVNIELVDGKPFGFVETSDHDFADRLVISEGSFTIDGKTMHLQKSDSAGKGGNDRRGGPRGRGGRGTGGRFNGGRGGNRGGRGGYNNRGGGYSNGGYGGFNQNNSYNQSGGYGQGGGYDQNAYGQGYGQQAYGQSGGYAQSYGSYDQNNQGYANYNQGYNQGGTQGQARHTPY